MNERINKLREQSLNAIPSISTERAKLLTEFYNSEDAKAVSVPVQRALSFKYILMNKELHYSSGELIVGERGPSPKATPTYPELCTHSEDDLDILNNREKVSFKVDEETKSVHLNEILPNWKNRSIREKIFEQMDDQWLDAYKAGVFTEFMEQRAPGHTVSGDKIYKNGMLDIIWEIQNQLNSLDFFNDKNALEKREELTAMSITCEALIKFAERYSDKLAICASKETDDEKKKELLEMSAICKRVPAGKPRTFWEALQYYWFVHLGVITELNTWDSFNPGRLDQHLYPFYKKEIENGSITKERARELLQSFWIKFNNQPAPPKVGVTAKESNTYTDFCLINVGGVKENGEDAVNELTYLILDVIEEMRLLQPSSMVQISKKNSDQLIKRALKIIKTGFGQPSLFNTDAIVQELVRQGKSFEDARNGGASGCVEAGAFGNESYILTGYFNFVKILELTLQNGWDPRLKKQIGLKTDNVNSFDSYNEFYSAFEKQLKFFIDIKIKGNLIIEQLYSKYMPAPFMSVLIDDCIKNGVDYNSGGARYNTSYIQGVGIGSVTDCLSSLKFNVYEEKSIKLEQLIEEMQNNFVDESLRASLMLNTPKYGNDDDKADVIAVRVFESFFKLVDGRPNSKGGHFRINLLPTTSHVYFGSVVGATPDGRKAFTPLSEGISPFQGVDVNGPTAVIKSASKLDHIRTGGTLLNQKIIPQVFEDENSVSKILHLIRTYFRMDGHHIQFNVVNAATLKKAQEEPENYRDLIVRVAGYSDYFVDLGIELQNEIIRRTEQEF